MFKIFWVEKENENIDEIEVEKRELEYDDEVSEEEWQVALDIVESPENITIISPISGVELDDIDISLEENVLTISWNRDLPEIFNDSKIIIRNSECFWGRFSRNIILPENLDLESIKAVLEKGILYITIDKIKFSSQTIKVKARV